MSASGLDRAVRAAGPRILAALAARYRNLDLAEEALADACARAAALWPAQGEPADPAGWLYRVAERKALDALRRQTVRRKAVFDAPPAEPSAEEVMMDQTHAIPDERLRLIFVCCHPAIAGDARAALTLRLVCGLTTAEIAQAFLVPEATLAQRLVRAKRKIAEAGVPFEIPQPQDLPDRLDAVLSTLEIAYAKAHEDAAGVGPHAGYAREILILSGVLCDLLPDAAEAQGLAALVRYAEARRPARQDDGGVMVPLSEQDPALWDQALIGQAETYLRRAAALDAFAPRVIQAAIHGAWCARRDLGQPAPWPDILALYDMLLTRRDDAVIRLNRAVALAEVRGAPAALAEIEALDGARLTDFAPYHAVRADLLERVGRTGEAATAVQAALDLGSPPAERAWLEAKLRRLRA